MNLHFAFHAALRAALREGLTVRAGRVRRMGEAIFAALSPLGFGHYVQRPQDRLPTVLALTLPAGLDDARLRGQLRDRQISVTGGLGPTAGLIWRLGLMGEAARPQPYRVFLHALEELLGERNLVARFDESWAAQAERVAVS